MFWFDVPGQPIMSFAGIWRLTEAGSVFAFLTIDPNAIVAPVHPKAMPVSLHAGDMATWLSADRAEAQRLVAPFSAQPMRVG